MEGKMNYKEALEHIHKMDAELKADDKRFRRSVYIIHEEGTMMFYKYAFFEKHGRWYYIFTEHHKTFVYDEEDIHAIEEYERVIK